MIDFLHYHECSKRAEHSTRKAELKKQYEIIKEDYGFDNLKILYVCEECGAYKLTEFESVDKGGGNG